MDKYLITNFQSNALKIIQNNNLISDTQLSYIFLMQIISNKNLFDIIIEEKIIDNDKLIRILNESFNIEILKPEHIYDIKILSYSKTEQYIKLGYFKYQNAKGEIRIAINNLMILPRILKETSLKNVNFVQKYVFNFLIEYYFSNLNVIKAKYLLNFISPGLTAKNLNYKKYLSSFLIIFISLSLYSATFFKALNIVTYFVYNILKLLLFNKAAVAEDKKFNEIEDYLKLPTYTILIPLYREERTVHSIIEAIKKLNYPKSKLDVKIIMEVDDNSTRRALKKLSALPSYFQQIIVPVSFPKTKPKALNYAMQFAKGEYLVIYDAEDQPDKNQLLEAVSAFRKLGEEYGCLQAKLNFFNKDQNLLTKFFSIEYSIWFNYLLKGLSLLNMPMPLGGTSNHFRTEILKKCGIWDSYNVTEDADLGIRFHALGYKIYILNSITLEESPVTIGNWLFQRSRWIKGYIQTFFVHTLQQNDYFILSPLQKLYVTIFMGLSSYGFFCLPWIFLISSPEHWIYKILWNINLFFSLSYLYGMALYILLVQKIKFRNFKLIDWLALLLWPLYFSLHMIAAHIAIWQCVTRPFKWNKTDHGVCENKPTIV